MTCASSAAGADHPEPGHFAVHLYHARPAGGGQPLPYFAPKKPTRPPSSASPGAPCKLRQLGTDLITLAGGQFIHPVKAVVGGMSSGIDAGRADGFRQRLLERAAGRLRTGGVLLGDIHAHERAHRHLGR